ncbi:unnamed protein product [Gongylonema pulchrum]|uniref:ACB domain-containing protein n=1 Tax=Gongylonema pulchrum TaxID=637853 RepID=A0A183DVM1_9BILA|nr:unnamed protein product [Gongylonema pulchrum]
MFREFTGPEVTFTLLQKWWGMNFDIAAEEMRRLDGEPTQAEKLQLYGLYKQAIHGDIPPPEDYRKNREQCEKEYVKIAEEMIKKYGRKIVRTKWNSEVWTVDY